MVHYGVIICGHARLGRLDCVKDIVGIFSLFGKKDRPPADAAGGGASPSKKRDEVNRISDVAGESAREQSALEQRQAARATALKIDAIESEMSSEFVRSRPTLAPAPAAASAAPTAPAAAPANAAPAATPATPASSTAAVSPPGTDSMLGFFSEDASAGVAPPTDAAGEDVPLFEEAAILFANGQVEMVGHLLQDAIEADQLGAAAITAWAMLFDLYQIEGDAAQFETLSLAYASRFESSPPAWLPLAAPEQLAGPSRAPAVPSVVFGGKLDASIVKTLEKARALADRNPALRLEFVRITEVDPIGCGLLLRVLNQLQKSGIDLILVGAPELVAKIRAILVVGRRDETEAPWLLLMELLALLNLETAFEEASIDYCVTFEVSPPPFVAPKNRVTTAMEEPSAGNDATDVFCMPALIEGRTTDLVAALREFAERHNPARIDCAALARVDVNAAGHLLSGLAPLVGDGRQIEFFNVNHLVAALLGFMGLKQMIRITTRKI